ncbi:DUF4328 domain-containing protein [Myceligenerans indicum]|uniref:DUF4328 domain-containing protein n=1 Tax=Myceligenerans indicum TaxID=2593663 RepID=A0ABS1LFB9_9MICO|nr:DUF4328 domain-containing protein [Myceligenerans indicum]MBL0884947.1 DUF4328 domain-containing protein [Myceligenerans indicum]
MTTLPAGPLPTVPTRLTNAAIVVAVAYTLMLAVRPLGLLLGTTQNAVPFGVQGQAGLRFGFFATSPLEVVIVVTTYVISCLWLHRSRLVAEAMTTEDLHDRGRIWAWLGWIVPVVALWFPYQVVRDVRVASGAFRPAGIGTWWACWLCMGVTFYDSTDPQIGIASGTVTAALAIAACVLWIRIIRGISLEQRAWAATA